MKWSDLTLKERKQIYDAVRAENPNASYFDIKSQFDSIPGYEDGKYTPSPYIIDFIIKREGFIPSPIIPKGDSKLTVGYGFTDPYIINKYKNQEITRLEADSILTEELSKRVVPFIESTPNFNKLNGNQRDALFSYFYNFGEGNYRNSDKMQTALKEENWKEVANQIDADYTDPINKGARKRRDAERALFLTPITSVNNFNEPYKEVNPIITWDQIVPAYEEGGKKVKPPKELGLTPGTPEYYKRQQQSNKNAKISRVRDVQDYGPVVDDYVITIDPLQYLPGTANHELGHLADQLASDANNRYLTYLLDEGNIMGPGELRNKGININPNMQAYLLDPSESKSHMLHLKRALVNEGKIHDWSSKVNQNTIEDFLFDPRNTGVVNNANKLQYNMYRNKSRFVDRINNLTPMEFITPLLLPVAGYEINKE